MHPAYHILNQYYDHIYVLTLARATGRQERIAQSLQGLNFSFYYGKDKNDFEVATLEQQGLYSEAAAKKIHRYNKGMTPGQVGCSWSHRCMYEDMIAHNYQRALIFEDDAVPDPEALHQTQAILDELPPDAELLFWGYGDQYPPGKQVLRLTKMVYHVQHALGLLKWNHTMINHLQPKPYSPLLYTAGFHDYTYAYGLTLGAARKLLQLQTPIQYIADNLLAWACTNQWIKGYTCRRKLFLHDQLPDGSPRDSFINEG